MILKLLNVGDGTSPRKRIKNVVEYIANPYDIDKNEKCYCTFLVNSLYDTLNLEEFYSVASLAKNSKSAFSHYVISWPENETPSLQELKEICHTLVGDIAPYGLAFAGLHVNTENLHFHLAIQKYTPWGSESWYINKNINRAHNNPLNYLHARIRLIEKAYGFAPLANSSVIVENVGVNNWSYRYNSKPRSTLKFRPKRPDTLPVIVGNLNLGLTQVGDFLYLDNENLPCMYLTNNMGIMLQWYRPELVSRIKNNGCYVHNINDKLPEIYLNDIINIKPPFKRKNIDTDFKKALPQDGTHISAQEEIAVRTLFDLDYSENEIYEYLMHNSQMEQDILTQLRIERTISSAKRTINRFREIMYNNTYNKLTTHNYFQQKTILEQKISLERKNMIAHQHQHLFQSQKKNWSRLNANSINRRVPY